MNAQMFLAGVILFGLLIAQLYKVYKADKEYKQVLDEYMRLKNRKKRK